MYSILDEDISFYKFEWDFVFFDILIGNILYDMCFRLWCYYIVMEFKSVLLWGIIIVYLGGGYVVEFGYYFVKLLEVIVELEYYKWID